VSDAPNSPLEYGTRPPRVLGPLKRHWRAAGITACGLAISWLPFQIWPWLWHGSDAYWEHRCRTYRAPNDSVVYDEYRTAAEANFEEHCDRWGEAGAIDGRGFASYGLHLWRQYPHQIYRTDYIAFLHEREARGRPPRLVTVPFRTLNSAQRDGIELRGIAVNVLVYVDIRLQIPLSRKNRMRLFAGQPDPADDSHFTIKYEIDHVPGTIDGWLQPDDTVKLQIRDGPAVSLSSSPALNAPTTSATTKP
jgi:hypothetical protein